RRYPEGCLWTSATQAALSVGHLWFHVSWLACRSLVVSLRPQRYNRRLDDGFLVSLAAACPFLHSRGGDRGGKPPRGRRAVSRRRPRRSADCCPDDTVRRPHLRDRGN